MGASEGRGLEGTLRSSARVLYPRVGSSCTKNAFIKTQRIVFLQFVPFTACKFYFKNTYIKILKIVGYCGENELSVGSETSRRPLGGLLWKCEGQVCVAAEKEKNRGSWGAFWSWRQPGHAVS